MRATTGLLVITLGILNMTIFAHQHWGVRWVGLALVIAGLALVWDRSRA